MIEPMMTYKQWLSNGRRQFLLDHLIAAHGNQCTAAETMDVHRNTLYRMMKEENIRPVHLRAIRANIPFVETTKHAGLVRHIYREGNKNV